MAWRTTLVKPQLLNTEWRQRQNRRALVFGDHFRPKRKRFTLALWTLFSLTAMPSSLPPSISVEIKAQGNSNDRATERRDMVVRQIRRRGVTNPLVLSAMETVPRHRFVPNDASLQSRAYADTPLPIDQGQTISQPYIVAYMTEALQLPPNARVLEIGTGSGYQAAILAEIATEVYSIEIVPELATKSRELLNDLGYDNVDVRMGDGYGGWPEEAPFDGVIVTAAPGHIPPALVEQLAEGARLVIPVGKTSQAITIVTKQSAGSTSEITLPVRFVPMTGEAER